MHFSFTHVFFYRFAIKAGGFPVMKILLFIHFLFFVVYFFARSFRFCETVPYMLPHPLTPLQWQAAGCTSPHDRCGRVLRS